MRHPEQLPQTRQIARFALGVAYEQVPPAAVTQLKVHLLDAIGSLVHSLNKATPQKLMQQMAAMGEDGRCRVPVLGHLPADRAAQLYTALIRYVDFMDNFLAKHATCHPSDNIGPLLAAAQLGNASGRDFLTAMAVAYQVECRLTEQLPVMTKGFDHTVLLGYSATAGLARLLQLTEEQAAHALAMAGCTINPLVSCRASYTPEWKGLASSLVVHNCMQLAMLARQGLSGPLTLFEGPMGIKDIYGMELRYDWSREHFNLIERCILKSYNSEVHTQTSVEIALELQKQHNIRVGQISGIDVTTFLTCYHIVGGGKYGSRKNVHSKEQADHSLPYVLAVALLDGEVYPAQLLPERIAREDVQQLLKKIKVHTVFPLKTPRKLVSRLDPYTRVYPNLVPAKVSIRLSDGKTLHLKKDEYRGFFTRPLHWADITDKFLRLTKDVIDEDYGRHIVSVIADLENRPLQELTDALADIRINNAERPATAPAAYPHL